MNNSELNNKYFIDDSAFNCPFCGLRNTTYRVIAIIDYNLSNNKKSKAIFVICLKCSKVSLHFVKENIEIKYYDYYNSIIHLEGWELGAIQQNFFKSLGCIKTKEGIDIDSQIFHSIPSSSFTMDERIPKSMRDLFDEAQECKRANLKTGASACLRKLIYTFIHDQLNAIKGNNPKLSIKDMGFAHYGDCIKELKEKYSSLDVFFDQLKDITGITSDQVHEESWAEMTTQDLNICLESVKDLLYEIYVQPLIREEKRNKILSMRQSAENKTAKKKI